MPFDIKTESDLASVEAKARSMKSSGQPAVLNVADLMALEVAPARLLAAQDAAESLTDEDAVPEVPQTPASAAGDLWVLGRHRLLCGDATNKQAVSRLLGAVKPMLMITDPPDASRLPATVEA